MSSSIIPELESALASEATPDVLAAAWDALDLVGRVADSVVWGGGDELQAMAAAQACTAGRMLLPLPEQGAPHDVPAVAPGGDGLRPHVDLLLRVQEALRRTASGEDDGLRQALDTAAGHAGTGAAALAAVRAQ